MSCRSCKELTEQVKALQERIENIRKGIKEMEPPVAGPSVATTAFEVAKMTALSIVDSALIQALQVEVEKLHE